MPIFPGFWTNLKDFSIFATFLLHFCYIDGIWGKLSCNSSRGEQYRIVKNGIPNVLSHFYCQIIVCMEITNSQILAFININICSKLQLFWPKDYFFVLNLPYNNHWRCLDAIGYKFRIFCLLVQKDVFTNCDKMANFLKIHYFTISNKLFVDYN